MVLEDMVALGKTAGLHSFEQVNMTGKGSFAKKKSTNSK